VNALDKALLKRCVELSEEAARSGNHPFGALLADREGNILVESGNIEVTERDCTGHAETTVMRLAGKKHPKEFLWKCTLYTTAEPCCMCVGAIYWGNVGRVVFGITEKQLLELTGSHKDNPAFDLPSREIIARGQKKIEIVGPVADSKLQEEIIGVHRGYWKQGE
jgi:tRNA(Arg) A34 adenosine deaminase TadA